MSITDYDQFNHLCSLTGIIDSYYDIRGQHHVASLEAKRALLRSMHIDVENDADVNSQIEQMARQEWQTVIPPVLVFPAERTPASISLSLSAAQVDHAVEWQIIEESGQAHRGDWRFEAHHATRHHELDSVPYYRFAAQLPMVDTGYHRLIITPANAPAATASLIVTPDTCYQPAAFEEGRKAWGVNLQLYSLRSSRNWGIGDFTDLRAVIGMLAPLGVDLIGLNPLHTLFAHLPENASPYSPSSREFLNPVYLDIESVEEFERCDAAQKLVSSADFQRRLRLLRDAEFVQYSEVWQTKSTVLKLLYQQFREDLQNETLETTRQFRQYQADKGEALFRFALFEALQAFFHQQDAAIEHWQQWPADFRQPESASVNKWAHSNNEAIEYHHYLQFRTEQQWSQAGRHCRQLGMRIGLYGDLAVGNERFSSQCWSEQAQYALDVSVGAPPDDLNQLGQDWGLPPQIPQRLRDQGYRLFIETLRANMRYTGALRIDHVMGLMRLYWVAQNYSADQGTYVSYPFEDLLGILCLESQRNRCLIVGEDLGTVPDEVRHQLWLKKILSYRVLFFEKDWNHGNFRAPHEYPVFSLCTSGSHDMPTLKSYWRASDIELSERLKLYPSAEIKQQLIDSRGHDRYQIKAALHREQLIDEATLHDDSTSEINTEFFLSVQRFLARSASLLMTTQLEDLLSQCGQVNLPGTIDEYPNWRHKVSVPVEDWLDKTDIENICLTISRERERKD